MGPQLRWHINCLELLAVRLALSRLRGRLQGKDVLVHTDNTATVAYINRQGGLHSRRMSQLDAEVLGDLPQEVALTIASARAPSTRRAYALKWNLFVEWCSSHREDPRRCSIRAVLSFLQQGLERRLSPSTLKVYVAAISAHHDPRLPTRSLGFIAYVSNRFPPVFSPQTGSGTERPGSESACGVLTLNSPESSLTR